MMESKVFADNFSRSFSESGDFFQFLSARQARSKWMTAPSKELRFEPVERGSTLGNLYMQIYDHNGDADVLEDTMENTSLLLKVDGKDYPVRSCALKTVLERARISGHALNKVSKSVFAEILNYCMGVASGDSLIKVADEKVSAVHGGDPKDYTVMEMLPLALRNLINNMYSRDLSTKVRSAFRTRNLRGEYWGGNGFYGYQVHPHNKKRLIVDEQVRDIIVMIFESCVAGMTTSEIAQMLNDMGIPSPLEHKRRNGGFYNGVVKEETGIWLKGAVRKILTDERYTGKMIANTRETEEVGKPKMRSLPRDQWIIVPGTHEAIISEELFRTAQNALQGRIRNVNKNTAGNRANNLFVCGCCGRKLRKNPAKEPHLVCPKNDSIKGAECAGLFVNQAQIEQAVLQMLREQSRSFLEQHCLMQACIDKKLSSIQTELDANTNMTRRLQSRKAELYEQYRAGRISREKFADIQKTDSEKLARLSSRAEEIKRLLVEHYESRGNLAAGKRTADQIILLKDYDPEIIRNFVERVRVYPSGEIEIDMRTSSGFEFVTAS